MKKSAFGTLSDAIAAFESNNHSQEQDLVLLPPPPGRYASGEVRDDDIGYAANIELPGDIAGTIEIHQKHVDSDSGTDEEENPPAKSNAKKRYQYFFIQA